MASNITATGRIIVINGRFLNLVHLILFIVGSSFINNCTLKANVVPNVESNIVTREPIPLDVCILFTEEDSQYIYKGNLGGGLKVEIPLGIAIKDASIQAFSQVFENVYVCRSYDEMIEESIYLRTFTEEVECKLEVKGFFTTSVKSSCKIEMHTDFFEGENKIWEKTSITPFLQSSWIYAGMSGATDEMTEAIEEAMSKALSYSMELLAQSMIVNPTIKYLAKSLNSNEPSIKYQTEDSIHILPTGKIAPESVAVIIGNKTYRDSNMPSVDFADRDATLMRNYIINGMGYDPANIIFMKNATLSDLNNIFGTYGNHKGKLYNLVKANKSDVFVYYVGHGAPDIETKGAYLVPIDADPNYISMSGYPMELLWKNLETIQAKKMTIILDTCFSGNSIKGSLIKGISPALLVVNTDLHGPNNSVVMTSAAPDQVSTWYPEKKHSLFTYWWIVGIMGEADENENHEITVDEMSSYLKENVSYWARRLSGREQNPVVFGLDDHVLIRLEK